VCRSHILVSHHIYGSRYICIQQGVLPSFIFFFYCIDTYFFFALLTSILVSFQIYGSRYAFIQKGVLPSLIFFPNHMWFSVCVGKVAVVFFEQVCVSFYLYRACAGLLFFFFPTYIWVTLHVYADKFFPILQIMRLSSYI